MTASATATVWHYDGINAVRQQGQIEADGDNFLLSLESGASARYSFADLSFRSDHDDVRVFGLRDTRGWQIGITGPVPPAIEAKLPRVERLGGWFDRIGLAKATFVSVLLSAVAVFAIIKSPDIIAPLIPFSWEQKLGNAMVGDFGGRFCNGPGGQPALDALVQRLDPGNRDFKVRVANIDMVNAVALPGGTIIVFRGLLQEAKSPDELAGVIGHEIGHVRNRDVMQSLLRQAGLSLLLGGVGGDAGSYTNTLISASYSRDAEAEADKYSIRLMQKAGVSPEDTAGFFARLAAEEAKLGKVKAALGYLSSHPLSDTREAMFRRSQRAGQNYTPAITPQQWRALVDSCANDPDVKADDGFLF